MKNGRNSKKKKTRKALIANRSFEGSPRTLLMEVLEAIESTLGTTNEPLRVSGHSLCPSIWRLHRSSLRDAGQTQYP